MRDDPRPQESLVQARSPRIEASGSQSQSQSLVLSLVLLQSPIPADRH